MAFCIGDVTVSDILNGICISLLWRRLRSFGMNLTFLESQIVLAERVRPGAVLTKRCDLQATGLHAFVRRNYMYSQQWFTVLDRKDAHRLLGEDFRQEASRLKLLFHSTFNEVKLAVAVQLQQFVDSHGDETVLERSRNSGNTFKPKATQSIELPLRNEYDRVVVEVIEQLNVSILRVEEICALRGLGRGVLIGNTHRFKKNLDEAWKALRPDAQALTKTVSQRLRAAQQPDSNLTESTESPLLQAAA